MNNLRFILKGIVTIILFFLFQLKIYSQTSQDSTISRDYEGALGIPVVNDIYEKIHTKNDEHIPYYYLREADVMWKKRIWRILDLKEKMNLPLYYPTDPIEDRISLIDLILYCVDKENLEVYDAALDDEFKVPMTYKQIREEVFGAVDEEYEVEDVETGIISMRIIKGELHSEEVKQYMLKEVWFFDNQRSIMDVRIIGLCPIRIYSREDNLGMEEEQKQKVCWVYFPSLRHILSRIEVFNPYNTVDNRSFDDIFMKRRFSSFICQEANVYDNRFIGSYKIGIDIMYESEKIKDFIFKTEHDLWEF